MADLSPLQNLSLLVGVVGGVLGAINTFQSWRRNRPKVSVYPGSLLPGDGVIGIVITNPGSQPITVTGSRCIRGPHYLTPEDDEALGLSHEKEDDLNFVIEPSRSEKMVLSRGREGAFLLLIYWHSNTALIFSLWPLVVFRTRRQAERLKRTKRRT